MRGFSYTSRIFGLGIGLCASLMPLQAAVAFSGGAGHGIGGRTAYMGSRPASRRPAPPVNTMGRDTQRQVVENAYFSRRAILLGNGYGRNPFYGQTGNEMSGRLNRDRNGNIYGLGYGFGFGSAYGLAADASVPNGSLYPAPYGMMSEAVVTPYAPPRIIEIGTQGEIRPQARHHRSPSTAKTARAPVVTYGSDAQSMAIIGGQDPFAPKIITVNVPRG